VPASTPFLLAILRRRVLSLVSPNALLPVTCVLGLTIVLSIWAFYVDRAEQEKTVARQAAATSSENIVLIVATNLEEVLGRATLYARIAVSEANAAQPNAFHLNPQRVGDSAYVRAALFDAGGALVYSSARQDREPELQQLLERAGVGPRLPDRPRDLLSCAGARAGPQPQKNGQARRPLRCRTTRSTG